MRARKNYLYPLIGSILIIIGLWLVIDFIIEFIRIILGFLLIIIGILLLSYNPRYWYFYRMIRRL